MKKSIHPEYFPQAAVKCACGNSFKTGSTLKELDIEICSNCHPFYTGKQKLIDTAGMVDKFRSKVAKQVKASAERKGKKVKKAKSQAKKVAEDKK
ncbi:MAG: 50S ribosomal protein L31 [Patescibacteria group bacterium]|jgi:large subunit ribosomal protein L31